MAYVIVQSLKKLRTFNYSNFLSSARSFTTRTSLKAAYKLQQNLGGG